MYLTNQLAGFMRTVRGQMCFGICDGDQKTWGTESFF